MSQEIEFTGDAVPRARAGPVYLVVYKVLEDQSDSCMFRIRFEARANFVVQRVETSSLSVDMAVCSGPESWPGNGARKMGIGFPMMPINISQRWLVDSKTLSRRRRMFARMRRSRAFIASISVPKIKLNANPIQHG